MLKVLVVNENHLQRTPDGKFWSKGIVDYSIFQRYASVFDTVYVAMRTKDVIEKDMDYIHLCNGEHVEVLPLPDFSGTAGYIRSMLKTRKVIRDYCRMVDCAIIRTPSAVSFQFLRVVNKKMPYALEVSGDPWFWMAPGEYNSKLRSVIRRSWTWMLKTYCMKANGVSYVTKEALQKRYPCKAMRDGESSRYFTSFYSTVSINNDRCYPAKEFKVKDCYKIVHVSNAMTTYSKGHKETIEIVKRLIKNDVNVRLEFIGDGPLRKAFEQYAVAAGIEHQTKFVGRLNRKELVWEALRKADLFLFPTHSEGLPRVVIESLYVGTPVVSTNVGGIPELLDEDCISNVGDVERMYEIVEDILKNPKRMSELSKKGIEKAKEYTEDVLNVRRNNFYRKLERVCVSYYQKTM